MARWTILPGDCRETLATLDVGSVQTCVTSPPYFGLRDYGHDGQIGLEPTPDEFVSALVGVFRAVRRVLRDDGTVWLNLGDSYTAGGEQRNGKSASGLKRNVKDEATRLRCLDENKVYRAPSVAGISTGVKPKDLIGIPWMVAFALRADGWYLRSDIIWAKPNPMPEPSKDRPTKAHEYLFLLSKASRYYYDYDAIKEPPAESTAQRAAMGYANGGHNAPGRGDAGPNTRMFSDADRNRRSVWSVATAPYKGAHFATFPPKLIEPCILAGSRSTVDACARRDPGASVVLDPFAGAGTTGMVALRHDRSFIGCELNADYVRLARDRIIADSPLLNTHAEAS